jgi:Calcineurin-like phosphoesterase
MYSVRRSASHGSVLALAVMLGCSEAPVALRKPSVPDAPQLTTGNPINAGSRQTYTLAVLGDIPYTGVQLAALPALVSLINADPKVDLVVHVGDIKMGRDAPCTDEYFAVIRSMLDEVKDPLVYTPGDNEWTDCHVARFNNGLYTPTERLQALRELFYPVPGQTLGGRKKQVLTQADDPANAVYVENVMWMESQVVFAAVHVTGSNNNLAPWGTPLPANAGDYPSQAAEYAARSQANTAWIARAFATATDNDAAGVVLILQADMWAIGMGALNGTDELVQQIGTLAGAFGKPVLMLAGDSHVFRVDQPFSPTSPLFVIHPSTPVAQNVTRIVVDGGPTGRTEYLRLTVSPVRGEQLFSWERVPLQ